MRAIKLAVGSVFVLTAVAFAQKPPVTPPASTPAAPPTPSQKDARGFYDVIVNQSGKPTLEELLAKALQNSPDVQVAEAKLREAEALLRQTRMQVAQKIVEIHTTAEQQQHVLANAEADYKRLLQMRQAGAVSSTEMSEAERKLLAIKGQLAQIENSVNALTGKLPALMKLVGDERINGANAMGGGLGMGGGGLGGPPPEPKMRHPSPVMAEKMRKALGAPIKIPERGFDGVPLREVFEMLRTLSPNVPFMIHLGEKANEPIKIDFRGELTLAGFFQLLGDAVPDLRIIVRDYGFLVTTDASVPEDGMKVADYWEGNNGNA